MQVVDRLIFGRNCLGNYASKDLDRLWSILKGKLRTSPISYDPLGLVQVPFRTPLDEFEKRAREARKHVEWLDDAKIYLDLEEALKILPEKRIFLHHLCCAGNPRGVYDNAINIYYMGERDTSKREKYGIIIPGINYLPDRKTVEECRRRKRIDEKNYERWMGLIEKFEVKGI